MFDYHIHSKLSFDSKEEPQRIIQAAKQRNLKEICFTDHYDFHFEEDSIPDLFTVADYREHYDHLAYDGLLIRRGVELGMTTWNYSHCQDFLQQYPFDYVLGSVHFAKGYDPYREEYWQGKTVQTAFREYMEQVLACVQVHEDFDVLGHINYVCKSRHNPDHQPLFYKDYREISDEIMKILVQQGKGMEVNTSGVDRCGAFLPGADFLKRFRELGGEIVTIGSDAHAADRVGQYAPEALAMLKDIFGYACTFADRKPIFHKL